MRVLIFLGLEPISENNTRRLDKIQESQEVIKGKIKKLNGDTAPVERDSSVRD